MGSGKAGSDRLVSWDSSGVASGIMRKMNFDRSKGLGKTGQGMKDHIEALSIRPKNLGLGFIDENNFVRKIPEPVVAIPEPVVEIPEPVVAIPEPVVEIPDSVVVARHRQSQNFWEYINILRPENAAYKVPCEETDVPTEKIGPKEAIMPRETEKVCVILKTTLGDLKCEIFSDQVQKTAENFLALCARGYYNGTIFHRNIKGFIIQGGDPTGTGKGGTSIWGKHFNDEIRETLKHSVRGVLSMANSGPNTNGSQFFITYKSQPHLNGLNTVFGKVIHGFEVLNLMEKTQTDTPIRLNSVTTIHASPQPHATKVASKSKRKKRRKKTRRQSTASCNQSC